MLFCKQAWNYSCTSFGELKIIKNILWSDTWIISTFEGSWQRISWRFRCWSVSVTFLMSSTIVAAREVEGWRVFVYHPMFLVLQKLLAPTRNHLYSHHISTISTRQLKMNFCSIFVLCCQTTNNSTNFTIGGRNNGVSILYWLLMHIGTLHLPPLHKYPVIPRLLPLTKRTLKISATYFWDDPRR